MTAVAVRENQLPGSPTPSARSSATRLERDKVAAVLAAEADV
jgi:hypothetical protein